MKSISNQILVYIFISLCVVFIGRFFYGIHIRTQYEKDKLEQNNIRACERLAALSQKPIIDKNLDLIKSYINVEALDNNIHSIQIVNQSNLLYGGVLRVKDSIYSINSNKLINLNQDSIVRPILDHGKKIGKVVLYTNNEPLEKYTEELKKKFFLELTFFFIILAIIQFFILKKVIINPLSSLRNWVRSIETDKEITKPESFHSTEIDVIIDSVSQLTNRLTSTLNENFRKSIQISEKESLITSVSKNLTEGMIFRLITNENGFRKFTYLSDSFKKIYGFSPEEGTANPSLIFDRIVKEDIQVLLDAEIESRKNLSPYRCEVRMINPDGTIRVSKFVSTPTVLEDGSICWDGFELDITNLKKAQADLQQNQFLLESIAEGLPDGIFAKDLDGRYLFLNSAVAKRANKTPQELLGKDNRSIFAPEAARITMEKDLEIMTSGVTQTFEEQLTTMTGEVVFLTTKGPIKDEKGKIIGLFGIARDITDRKRSEEALRVSQEKFAFAFNSSPNAILIQDEESGKYLTANSSATKIFGYSNEEILGNSPVELKLYKDLIDRDKILKILKEKDFIQNMELVGRHKLGMNLHLLITLARHYIDNKPILYVIIQDVTERKMVELELQKLNLDKDRFISILGHDLRGPVNSTIALLDVIKSNFDDMPIDEFKEIIDLVYQSTKGTSKLLDDVLLWATAKSGKMEFNPQKINFREDGRSFIKLLQLRATSKNIEVEFLCEDSLEVYADKNMLAVVLRNLISNALKFTHEGGKISLLAKKNPETTIISIADNGVGIAANDICKIFDKAQLFTSIGTNEEKGTGFGLKLCQEFVEKHGGRIWVESEVGVGTTFYFSLPNVA
ncbi:PAS domain S-box protein [Flavobacterium sp.]|uniref:PAS domain S-box protein n=1 Tax=Flavobacterium sp. TaxID=239 RepID=UPI002BA6386C|nr:PAS domain S-box protein [Flavobacterium sp.]HSD07347.1 PAS domain S-box protein [Flavobacterium sp.]